MDWLSLLLPFAYLGVLLSSLYTFSHLYRSRKAAQARALAPWFGPHVARDAYLSLLELQASPDTKVPDAILRAALLRRAYEDVQRLLVIQNGKAPLAQLLQRGSVGDELWQRFLLAEKELGAELKQVQEEANALAPQQNWAAHIFQSAMEMLHNEKLRQKLLDIDAQRGAEKARFETRRESVREDFIKELDSEATSAASASASTGDSDAVVVDGADTEDSSPVSVGGSEGSGSPASKKNKNNNSSKKKGKK